MTTHDKAGVGRRDILRVPGVSAGVASVGASLATGVRADSESRDERRKPRYRETEDAKAFYRVN
jgi:hypothetical protein